MVQWLGQPHARLTNKQFKSGYNHVKHKAAQPKNKPNCAHNQISFLPPTGMPGKLITVMSIFNKSLFTTTSKTFKKELLYDQFNSNWA